MSGREKAQITVHVDQARDIINIKGNVFWVLHGTTVPFVTNGRLQGLSAINRISVSIDGATYFECQPAAKIQDALAQSLAYAIRLHGLSLNNDDIEITINIDEPPLATILKQARQIEAARHERHSQGS